jgi:HD-GYP domain-containing protein (c-di-GMP phosphodiesterase class II)
VKELEIVKQHPYQGAEMLTRIKGLGSLPVRAIIVAMEHHLGADLSGYPKVTKRKAVNLFSRIISIADVFDAMTTSRVYRERAFTGDEAIAEMMKESGTKFDPLLLKAFTQMLGIFPVGTAVLLNTGELAVVIETNHDPSCQRYPTIKLIVDDAGRRKDGPVIDLASQNDVVDSVTRKIVKSVDAHYYRVDVTNYL